MKKIVFFDLDGTLTDPMMGITNSVMYALKCFGIEEKDREKLKSFIGPPLADSFMKSYGFSEKKAGEALNKFREYFSEKGIFENSVYPGCEKMLKNLYRGPFNLAVASSKPEPFVKRILDHFGLSKYFNFIGGSDMEETRARKDQVIAYCLEALGSPDPRDCLMVGDRRHDIEGAAKYGIESVGVLYGFGTEEELRKAGADHIVKDFYELEKLITSL